MGDKRSFRATKNFVAGLMFIMFGLLGVLLSWPLDSGTPSDMGPGYFPRGVCILLILLGGALSASDLMQEGERIEGWAWKPLILVTLSSLVFAFLLQPVGLVGTLVARTVLASAASTLLRPVALTVLTAVMILTNVGIFVFALKMPIPLWPSVF